ncbi:MAG: hypothetical protein H0W40_17550 [Methylibium sp.]|nr:hypothetical protein [Methylibium sp.]MBA3599159.1 hypothetical protein [Methylibium sp.]
MTAGRSDIEYVPQHVKRHAPAPAVTCTDRGGALVDAHDHAGDAAAIAIFEGDRIAALELSRLRPVLIGLGGGS